MLKKILITIICLAIFVVFGYTVPIRIIEVDQVDKVYEYSGLDPQTVVVKTKTLFGKEKTVSGYDLAVKYKSTKKKSNNNTSYEIGTKEIEDAENTDNTISADISEETNATNTNSDYVETQTYEVRYGFLNKEINVDYIEMDHLEAIYEKELYEHEDIDESMLHVSAIYKDGHSESVDDYTFSQVAEDSENCTIAIWSEFGNTKIQVETIPVVSCEAFYNHDYYMGEEFDSSLIEMRVRFADGTIKPVRYTCDASGEYFDNTEIEVSSEYGTATFELEPIQLDSIETEYTGNAYQLEEVDTSLFKVWFVYKDGREQPCDSYDVEFLKEDEVSKTYTIKTRFGDREAEVPLILVSGAMGESKEGKFYAGYPAEFSKITLLYEDGFTKEYGEDEITPPDEDDILSIGENSYPVQIKGMEFLVSITAEEDTPAHAAKMQNKEELEEAIKSYTSENTYVAITKHETESSTYYLSHIVINDTRQIHAGLANDEYGGREKPTDASKRLNWVIGVNASNFDYETEEIDMNAANIVIKNGEVIYGNEAPTSSSTYFQNNPEYDSMDNLNYDITEEDSADAEYAEEYEEDYSYDDYSDQEEYSEEYEMSQKQYGASGREICLTSDARLFSAGEGQSVDSLLAEGVTDTFGCGDTELIMDGVKVNEGVQSEQARYPRTAIGMVDIGEYYIITAGTIGYERGMTYDEVRDVLYDHGCTFGKCMDGGGSASLVFENELINTPADEGKERAVVDFLYFTDLEE